MLNSLVANGQAFPVTNQDVRYVNSCPWPREVASSVVSPRGADKAAQRI